MTGFDTESLSLAGAFLAGAILATLATLHIVRSVTNYFRDQWHRRDRH